MAIEFTEEIQSLRLTMDNVLAVVRPERLRAQIAELNEKYRHKEGPTDVLSFECDGVDDDLSAMTLAEDPVFELGDVIIAPDVASRQMREFGTTFEEEISLLLVHGLLHLCGYDHIEDDEAEVMEKREAEILEAWSKRTV